RRRGDHLISVRTEHKAVLDPLARLGRRGYEVTLLEVEQHGSPRAGWLDPQRVADAIREDTSLVSIMLANNEIGVIQPLREIAVLCRDRGVTIHCDATQAVGKIPVDVQDLNVDLMSFTAHKIYGPKGVGALYVRQSRPAVRLEPQITGGGQQDGLRSGTLNVAGIVGFARALELCAQEMPAEPARLLALRNQLWKQLRHGVDNLQLCGPALEEAYNPSTAVRLPGNLDVAFGNVDGEALLLAMGDLAVSSGAACSSTDPGPSHVLLALGMTGDLARSTLRFGLGRFNTAEEVDIAAATVGAAVNRLRKLG
ncbi:MAG: aminotransferase class V-fold PLP-dependent enzyme, partial [Pirellulales bacterium]|nr:aminotransferase class V-fold PLP-dependent enzyme [Pirellulales bacterium]